MSETVTASDGTTVWQLPLSSLAHVLGYNGSGQIITDTVEYQGKTFVQTFIYSGDDLTDTSEWVPQ